MYAVQDLGQRGNRRVAFDLRAGNDFHDALGLQHPDHVVGVALLAQHRIPAQAFVLGAAGRVVVGGELCAVSGIVNLQDGNGGGFQVRHVIGCPQPLPEGLFLLVQGEFPAVGILVGVAVGAVGDIDGIGANEFDRFAGMAVDDRFAGPGVDQAESCHRRKGSAAGPGRPRCRDW